VRFEKKLLFNRFVVWMCWVDMSGRLVVINICMRWVEMTHRVGVLMW